MPEFDLTLYLVTDAEESDSRLLLGKIEGALRGGVTLLQLRDKYRSGHELFKMAQQIKLVSDRFNVPLIIDDRADVALAVGAAGVHVGAEDLPVAAVRAIMGPKAIVGATAKTVEAALKAEADGADYLGVGAIYPTTTKVKTVLTPVSELTAINEAVKIPSVAIGGLTAENIDILKDSGLKGLAVVSAIMKASDSYEAARRLKTAANALIYGENR